MNRVFIATIGGVALLLGIVILVRGFTQHASILYDLIGVLFLGLGIARLYELRRRPR